MDFAWSKPARFSNGEPSGLSLKNNVEGRLNLGSFFATILKRTNQLIVELTKYWVIIKGINIFTTANHIPVDI